MWHKVNFKSNKARLNNDFPSPELIAQPMLNMNYSLTGWENEVSMPFSTVLACSEMQAESLVIWIWFVTSIS